MSKDGHVVTLKVVAEVPANRVERTCKDGRNSAKVRLDGNVSRRSVKSSEFF